MLTAFISKYRSEVVSKICLFKHEGFEMNTGKILKVRLIIMNTVQ